MAEARARIKVNMEITSSRADALDVMVRAEKWEEKYGKNGAGVTLDLSGFKLGNKI